MRLENAAASWVCLVKRVSCRGRDRRDMAPGSWTLKHGTLVAVACPIVKPILATASQISGDRLYPMYNLGARAMYVE